MEERRRSIRTELNISAVISSMDGRNPKELQVDVKDLSKTGIGFECTNLLGIGTVYDADITIWTQETIHVFLKVVRIELLRDGYAYGATFIGMPQNDSQRIEVYQAIQNDEN